MSKHNGNFEVYGDLVVGANIYGSTLFLSGSTSTPNVLVSTSITLNDTHDTVCVDATAGPITITLPDTASLVVRGRRYTIKKVDSSVNDVTVLASGSDLIDGATTTVISTQYQARRVHARTAGGTWDVI